MLLWFIIVAPVLVAEVFKSPMVDYRLVALGAVLPLAEVGLGHPFALHSLLGPVAALAAVMLGTINRRLLRRRLLGIPIGMFCHLVLDGSWNNAITFWWPVFGWSLADEALPEAGGIGVRLLLEPIAIAIGLWAARRYGLDRPENRMRLWRHGNLSRSDMPA